MSVLLKLLLLGGLILLLVRGVQAEPPKDPICVKTSNGWNAASWKLRTWTDANTAILYAPCYGRPKDLKGAFLFTLKFDQDGNWKIIKTHQMSKKELEEEQ